MDLSFIRGDTQFIRFPVKDGEGNLVELSPGDRLYFTVKTDPNSKTILFQKKFPEDITYSEGYYSFTINSEDTSNLNYTSYQYDIELKTGDYVKTLGSGTITLEEEITHRRDE